MKETSTMKRIAILLVALLALPASSGDFVTGNATLPPNTRGTKVDARPLPAGADATRFITAPDINEHTSRIDALVGAAYDLRAYTHQVNDRVAGAESTHASDKAAAAVLRVSDLAAQLARDAGQDAAIGAELSDVRAEVASAAMSGGVNIADTSTVLATGAAASKQLADHLGGLSVDRARGGAHEIVRRLDLSKARATRPAAPLTTPVPYFGDEIVHPDIYFNAAGWNGHRYWMAATPYEASNSDYENPSIYYSDDGETWATPPGLTNPIVGKPAYGYNSDTDLVDGHDGRLYLFYRVVDNVNGGAEIWVTSSGTAASWSTPVKVLEPDPAEEFATSQAVIFTGSTWVMYYVDARTGITNLIKRRTSPSPAGPWSAAVTVTIDAAPAGAEYWHLDAVNHGGQTILLLVTTTMDSAGGGLADLFFAWSEDESTFTRAADPVIAKPVATSWDTTLYRATFLPTTDGAEDKVGIWYSANGSSGWRIGYTEASLGRSSVAEIREQYADDVARAAVARACAGLVPVRVCDMFNRSDSATSPGGGWSVITGTMGISSRQLYQPTSVNSRAVVDAGTADLHTLVQLRTLGNEAWMIVRLQDSTNYLRFGKDSLGAYRLQRIAAGSAVDLWSGARLPPARAGDWLEVVTSGSSVTALINGIEAVQVTETTFQTATKVGLQANGATVRFGSFTAWSESVNADQDRYLGRVASSDWSMARACSGVGAGVACDTFLRPDATAGLGVSRTGHAWTVSSGAAGIASRQAYAPSGANTKAVVEAGVADGAIGVRVSVVGAEQFAVARYADANNYFRFGGSTTYQLQRIQGGSATVLANSLGTPAAGDWLELVLAGDAMKAYVNGALVWSGTDSFNLAATKHGFQISGTGTRLSAFYATSSSTFSVPAAPAGIVSSSAAAPTCNDGARGIVWVTRGAAGVKDSVQVCAKDAADAYGWRAIY
jgi:hypothetical protein